MYNFLAFMLTGEEPSFFEKLRKFFEKIKNSFFTPDLGEYENLNIGYDDISYVRIMILSIFAGIIIASIMAIFNKRTLGGFVRKIIAEDCVNPENAKTLSELGYMKNSAVRGSLKSGVTLKRVVRCVEEEEYYKQFGIEPRPARVFEEIMHGDKVGANMNSADEKVAEEKEPQIENNIEEPKKAHNLDIPPYRVDLNKAHFYIAKNDTYMADIKFEAKGANWVSFAFVAVISLVGVILLFKFLPDILQMFDNFVGSVKPDDNILR